MKADNTGDIEYLTSKGWKMLLVASPWRWVQPGTTSRWRFEDAMENQRAMDRTKGIGK